MQQDKSLFRFNRSRISLTATAWSFNNGSGKTPSTHAVIPFPTEIVVTAVQPHPDHVEGTRPSQSGGGTYLYAAKHHGSSRTSGESSLVAPPRDAVLTQDPCCSPAKPIVRWYQQFPSKPLWDFTLETACKLNKSCNIFVRQLH